MKLRKQDCAHPLATLRNWTRGREKVVYGALASQERIGLPEIGNPDAVKATEQEEIASNCGPDQGLSK
jgi:hypothetical protein